MLLRKRLFERVLLALSAILSAWGMAKAEDLPSCEGPKVLNSDGTKFAQYYVLINSGGPPVVQVMAGLMKNGSIWIAGNIVAYHNTADYGVGLNWLDGETLEVALAPEAKPRKDVLNMVESAQFAGRNITVRYRELRPEEDAWTPCKPR